MSPSGSHESVVEPRSLAETLDRLVELEFEGLTLAEEIRTDAVGWLAGRIGRSASYEGMPAPTEHDLGDGARLFTGEPLVSRASTAHILGEEACRALVRLGAGPDILASAQAGMAERFIALSKQPAFSGKFCCGVCTAAVWRHASTGAFPSGRALVPAGIGWLRSLRDGKGRWGRFPFWYTLLALADLDDEAADAERRYAAPVLDRVLRRRPGDGPHESRRRKLAERVLEAL